MDKEEALFLSGAGNVGIVMTEYHKFLNALAGKGVKIKEEDFWIDDSAQWNFEAKYSNTEYYLVCRATLSYYGKKLEGPIAEPELQVKLSNRSFGNGGSLEGGVEDGCLVFKANLNSHFVLSDWIKPLAAIIKRKKNGTLDQQAAFDQIVTVIADLLKPK